MWSTRVGVFFAPIGICRQNTTLICRARPPVATTSLTNANTTLSIVFIRVPSWKVRWPTTYSVTLTVAMHAARNFTNWAHHLPTPIICYTMVRVRVEASEFRVVAGITKASLLSQSAHATSHRTCLYARVDASDVSMNFVKRRFFNTTFRFRSMALDSTWILQLCNVRISRRNGFQRFKKNVLRCNGTQWNCMQPEGNTDHGLFW